MFILGDHLGSTSLVTDSTGAVINQTQYKAWGEERYSSGSKQTNYGYTGQYSYTGDFGLMFYNARWYDTSLGRFTQADSIIPAGVQGYDRYAYGLNNPIRYNDPSGHCPVPAITCLVGIGIVAVVVYVLYVEFRARETPVVNNDNVVSPTPTPTSNITLPPFSVQTSTVDPTLSSLMTATTPQAILKPGPTKTPTLAPTAILAPVDPKKILPIIAEDISNAYGIIEEVCTAPGMNCSGGLKDFPRIARRVELWENLVTIRDFIKSVEINIPSNGSPTYPTSTGTPTVIPAPAPRPTQTTLTPY